MIRVSIYVAFLAMGLSAPVRGAELPEAIEAKGEQVVLQVHAIGAQIYECAPDATGASAWRFREPIASLIRDGKTVGRHYAGPTWEIEDSSVVGKPAARSPGAGARDIAWLKLTVVEERGDGLLKGSTTVQRINTVGGALEGLCKNPGELVAEPYAADYRFLKK